MGIWENIRRAFGVEEDLGKKALRLIADVCFPEPEGLRDKNNFKDAAYFSYTVRDRLSWARYKLENDKRNGHRHVVRGDLSCVDSYRAFLVAGYSAGLPLNWVAGFAPELLDALEYFDPIYRKDNLGRVHNHILDSDSAGGATALIILAFFVGTRCDEALIRRLAYFMGESGRAPLHDRVAARFDPTWRIGSEFNTYKEYKLLVQAIDGAPEHAPALVKKYLKIWYTRVLQDMGGYNTHKGEAYVGYWCWEAALVVMLWDIDDSSFKDHKYYPDELVAYYRNTKPIN